MCWSRKVTKTFNHFDALFNNETAQVFSKMHIGYQIQSMVNIYIILTHEIAPKLTKHSLQKLHENVKHVWIFRRFLSYFSPKNCKIVMGKGVLLR